MHEQTLNADPAYQVCQALLLARANPTAQNAMNDTPLHLAAAREETCPGIYAKVFGAVTLLLTKKGAIDFEATGCNDAGQVPKHIVHRSRTIRRGEAAVSNCLPADDDRSMLFRLGFLAFENNVIAGRWDRWQTLRAPTFRDFLHGKMEGKLR